jgi:hypothetical protein
LSRVAVELPGELDAITIPGPTPTLRFPAQSVEISGFFPSQKLPREERDFDLCFIELTAMARGWIRSHIDRAG